MNPASSAAKQKKFSGGFLPLVLLLGGTLAVLCHDGFRPYEVCWANDLPLGALTTSSNRLPGAFFACWNDYFWIGGPGIVSLNLSNICMGLFTPEYHLKFYAPGTMFFLGLSAWFFFRQLRFAPAVCVLGGLAAGLNMHFFSNACWGLGQWNVCCAMIFIALGILVSPNLRPLWLKAVLAGFSTGMAVMEGFDVGAIMSVYVGIFVAFSCLTAEGKMAGRVGRTLLVGGLVVAAAVLISLSTIFALVLTQIKGTGADDTGQVVQQTPEQKEMRWQFITQWSIPKLETLRVIIPGLFGYRMQEFTTSTNKAGSYWGAIAEDPRVQGLDSDNPKERAHAAMQFGLSPRAQDDVSSDDPQRRQFVVESVKAQVQRRHTGNGEYAGMMVCLLAAFGLANSWRKAGSGYSPAERRAVWFWGGAGLFSLLAAWGRYGFAYRLVYAMPFLTNIRSPMKFMHPLNISLIILAGYGLETLHRRGLSPAPERSGSLFKHWRKWWEKAGGFEVKWILATGLALIAAVAGFFIVQSSEPAIVKYLEHNGFANDLAPQIASFCDGEIGMSAVFLALSAAVLAIILSGAWAGRRAPLAWCLLGVIIIGDLGRSDLPWVRYYNYKEKLSPNPVVDYLRDKPWEHRVVSRTSPTAASYDLGGTNEANINFGGVCHWWLENDYPYNDIESLEIDQAPRMPIIDSSYLGNFTISSLASPGLALRMWQLTNTRYIFADPDSPVFNFPGAENVFHTIMRVNIVPKIDYSHVQDGGDLTVSSNSQGTLALMEFTPALPRAKLYANWQVMDESNTLRTLASPQFDPEKTVLVDQGTALSQAPGRAGADAGEVQITQYASRDLILRADAKSPSVLLLNDHTGDYWNVWIDQKPAAILRCNYIMQGVFAPPGEHTIEFRYQPPRKLLYISLAAFATALLLGGYAMIAPRLPRTPSEPPSNRPKSKSK